MIPTPAQSTNLGLTPGAAESPPLPMRVYSVKMDEYPGLQYGYWVSFWSYRFFILRENANATQSARKQSIAKWLKKKNTRGAKELTRQGMATLYSSSVSVLDDAEESPVFHEQLLKVHHLKIAKELKKRR